jgi:CheY-like chemotaxis protein
VAWIHAETVTSRLSFCRFDPSALSRAPPRLLFARSARARPMEIPVATSGIYSLTERTTVLFVDDDADTLIAYQAVAGADGMNVEIASNGHEAITLASVVLPDVIVLDVGLPGLDGFEVIRRLRENPRTSHIPFIVVSGDDSDEVDRGLREARCEGHLLKPCSADELLDLVTTLAMRARHPLPELAKAEAEAGEPDAAGAA